MPGLKKASEARERKRANKADQKQELENKKRAAINMVNSFTNNTSLYTELDNSQQGSTSEGGNAKRRKCCSRKAKQPESPAHGNKGSSQKEVSGLNRFRHAQLFRCSTMLW